MTPMRMPTDLRELKPYQVKHCPEWYTPHLGALATQHHASYADAVLAMEAILKRLVPTYTHMGKTYNVGDVVVLYGRSPYDRPAPYSETSRIWGIDPGDGANFGPVLIVWDTMNKTLASYDLVTKAYPAESGYAMTMEIMHHEPCGPSVTILDGGHTIALGNELSDLIEDVRREGPSGFVACFTLLILDGRPPFAIKIGDDAGPEVDADDTRRLFADALGMTPEAFEAWSDGVIKREPEGITITRLAPRNEPRVAVDIKPTPDGGVKVTLETKRSVVSVAFDQDDLWVIS